MQRPHIWFQGILSQRQSAASSGHTPLPPPQDCPSALGLHYSACFGHFLPCGLQDRLLASLQGSSNLYILHSFLFPNIFRHIPIVLFIEISSNNLDRLLPLQMFYRNQQGLSLLSVWGRYVHGQRRLCLKSVSIERLSCDMWDMWKASVLLGALWSRQKESRNKQGHWVVWG